MVFQKIPERTYEVAQRRIVDSDINATEVKKNKLKYPDKLGYHYLI